MPRPQAIAIHQVPRTVALLLLAAMLGAITLHAQSALPAGYTWFLPVAIMWDAVNDPIFPAASLLTIASAIAFQPGATRMHSLQPTPGAIPLFALLVGALLITQLLKPDPWSPLQLGIFLPVAWIIAVTLERRGLLRSLSTLVMGLLLLVLVSYAYTIFKSQLLVGTSAHDASLVQWEVDLFGAPLYRLIADWSAKFPPLVSFCDRVYFLFFQHMALVALVLWVTDQQGLQQRYVISLASCYLVGGLSYYLLPALGPVYFDPQAFAYVSAHAPLSSWVQPSLLDATTAAQHGSLQTIRTYGFVAAVPSLHMAHEAIMAYYLRKNPLTCALSVGFLLLSGLSVLVLGWHYLFDIVAGLALAAIAIGLTEKALFYGVGASNRSTA